MVVCIVSKEIVQRIKKWMLSVTNLSLEKWKSMNKCCYSSLFALMTTGAFSQIIGKLFSELKLVTDNLLFIYAEAYWEPAEKIARVFVGFTLTV